MKIWLLSPEHAMQLLIFGFHRCLFTPQEAVRRLQGTRCPDVNERQPPAGNTLGRLYHLPRRGKRAVQRPAAKDAKNPAVRLSPCLHHTRASCSSNDVNTLSRFQKFIWVQASKSKPASNFKNLCIFMSDLYSTFSMRPHLTYVLVAILIPWVRLFLCSRLIRLS